MPKHRIKICYLPSMDCHVYEVTRRFFWFVWLHVDYFATEADAQYYLTTLTD
jgi:hypothetical protein